MRWLVLVGLMGCGDASSDSAAVYCRDIGPPLDWDSYGQAFFDQHCTGCHSSSLSGPDRNGAPDGVNFDTLAGAQAHWNAALSRVEAGHPATQTTGGGIQGADYTAEETDTFARYIQCSEDVP